MCVDIALTRYEQALTNGQRCLRAYILKRLSEYQNCSSYEEKAGLIQSIVEQCATDPCITEDRVTARPEGYASFSRAYLFLHERCENSSSSRTTFTSFPYDPLQDTYIFHLDSEDVQERKHRLAYQGGFNPQQTFEVMFELAQGIPPNGNGVTAKYFSQARVLTIEGGGRHRLLGQVLWGYTPLAATVSVIDDQAWDEDIHNLFRQFDEQIVRQIAIDEVFSDCHYLDGQAMYSLFASTSSEDRQILVAYMRFLKDQRSMQLCITPEWLLERHAEYRYLCSWKGRVQTLWKHHLQRQPISFFAFWYLTYYKKGNHV